MNESLIATVGYDRGFQARAFNAFWVSAAPRGSVNQRLLFWIFCWFFFMTVVASGSSEGVAPWKIALTVGIGIFAVVVMLQHSRMRRFYDEIGRHWSNTGEMTIRFDDRGLQTSQSGMAIRLDWAAVDAVEKVDGGTVFRAGMTMVAVPDSALPGGMTGEALRARVAGWRTPPAAVVDKDVA